MWASGTPAAAPADSDAWGAVAMNTQIQPAERDLDLTALGAASGYRVDDPNGRVGTVEAVVAGAWSEWPDALEVRVGMFRPAILVVGVEDVAGVDTDRRRVLLRACVDLANAYVP
jgi:hypothetical protein